MRAYTNDELKKHRLFLGQGRGDVSGLGDRNGDLLGLGDRGGGGSGGGSGSGAEHVAW